MSHIAVVGPGSVGLFFAGHLAAAGHDVVACARRPFERYVIESEQSPLDIAAKVVTDPAEIDAPAPWVLLAVKAHQTEGAAGWLDALCTPDTRVLVAQNGIEHDLAEPYVNGASIIPTVVYCGAELIEPGRIVHRSDGHLLVPTEPFGDELLELFTGSQAEVRPSEDFVTQQWRKLSLNVVANGLTALTNREMSVLGDESIYPVAVQLMRECWQVAEAAGADLDVAKAAGVIDQIVARAGGGTSMLYDTRAGRPTEHDAIHGAVLRAAATHGIDTPTVRFVHALLDARANSAGEGTP